MKTITDLCFRTYGKKLEEFDFSGYVDQIKKTADISIPTSGNEYHPSVKTLEDSEVFEWLRWNIYGGLNIQLGTCAGHNKNTTAVEYHAGSEVVIALTDCILPLGHTFDMDGNTYDAKLMEKFFLKKGEAVELFGTTLHYSPIESDSNGYFTLVALLKGTNEDLENKNSNPLLLKMNKYMIVHPSRSDKVTDGAIPGLVNAELD